MRFVSTFWLITLCYWQAFIFSARNHVSAYDNVVYFFKLSALPPSFKAVQLIITMLPSVAGVSIAGTTGTFDLLRYRPIRRRTHPSERLLATMD